MKTHLTVNLTTKTAKLNGSTWEPPVHTFGETATLALRFERDVEGQTVETSVEVEALWAGLGEIDTPPARGKFALQIGEDPSTENNTTALLTNSPSATDLQAAINALSEVVDAYGPATVVSVSGSYLIWFGDGGESVPVKVVNNSLTPIAFGKIRAREINGKWVHELRLVVAPVAFADTAERILPPPPSMTRIQAGGSEGETEWNEVQELFVPPEFRGTYQLKWGYKRTGLLSRADGPEEIQEALAVFGDTLIATNDLPNRANIEFKGEFAGESWPLLEVVVFNAPEGDLTFDLRLDRDELGKRFWTTREVTLPLEVKLVIREDGKAKKITAFRTDFTVRSELIFDELAEAETIDWLRPMSPKSYLPSHPSQVITGQQHYPALIGDGEATTITVDHPLETVLISSAVMYRLDNGKVLQPGVDYKWWRVVSDGSIEIEFFEAPTEESIQLVLTSAGPKSAFVSDLQIYIPQVIGLQDVLDDHDQRLETLEAILPTTGAGTTAGSGTGMTIDIPAIAKVMFWNGDPEQLDRLPRKGAWMLPAIHTDDPDDDLPTPLPEPSTITTPKVFKNNGEEAIKLPNFGKVKDKSKPPIILPGDYAACDGRAWYPVEQEVDTNSFYSTLYTERLFYFAISEKMFRVGRTLELPFGLLLQAINADSAASWVLQLRAGTAPQDTVPDPTGENLEDINWVDEPILRSRLLVGPLATAHSFGLRMKRSAGGIALDVAEYGVWEGNNDAAPETANFLIEGRLAQFDTQNSRPKASGHIFYKFFGETEGAPAQVKIY